MSEIFTPIINYDIFTLLYVIAALVTVLGFVWAFIAILRFSDKIIKVSISAFIIGFVSIISLVGVRVTDTHNFVNWAETKYGVTDIQKIMGVNGFRSGEVAVYSAVLNKIIYTVENDGGYTLYGKAVNGDKFKIGEGFEDGKKLETVN